jgi:hypothetical protein
MSYKRTSSKEEREQVNRLRNDLCPVRESVPKKARKQVNKLKIDLCPIRKPVPEKKENRLISKE